MVAGLTEPRPPQPHASQRFDWSRPNAGELPACPEVPARIHRDLVAARQRSEQQCNDALTPKLRARFDVLLELSQHHARLREEQVSQLTLGWPLARRALHRLGAPYVRGGVVGEVDDACFLERPELGSEASRVSSAAERRELWARSRRLPPPLTIGALPAFLTKPHTDAVARMRAPVELRPGMLEGMPASPGRVTRVARVLLDLADGDRLSRGEILVTPATTPASTPLFRRAAAVATHGGSLVAHASLVAREYGLPAVVALGDVTRRERDGQRVTVDGDVGVIQLYD